MIIKKENDEVEESMDFVYIFIKALFLLYFLLGPFIFYIF